MNRRRFLLSALAAPVIVALWVLASSPMAIAAKEARLMLVRWAAHDLAAD